MYIAHWIQNTQHKLDNVNEKQKFGIKKFTQNGPLSDRNVIHHWRREKENVKNEKKEIMYTIAIQISIEMRGKEEEREREKWWEIELMEMDGYGERNWLEKKMKRQQIHWNNFVY